jgi:hypothetical protein
VDTTHTSGSYQDPPKTLCAYGHGGLMAHAPRWGCSLCGRRVFQWRLLGDAAHMEPPPPHLDTVLWQGNWYSG